MDLVKTVLKDLEGSFAFDFMIHFPHEVITTRRGSSLLIGLKTNIKLKVDFIDVKYATAEDSSNALDGRTYRIISAQPYLAIP
ncbi:hypothetical protein M422DRAFT_28830 [Sphaerobolus stellatus SS14]|nr:hypothetical protein M422DRAFT_28830 [Sphaerobolus stellatus SS14]